MDLETLAPIVTFVEHLVYEGLAQGDGMHFRLKPAGRILADTIMAELPETVTARV